MWRRALALAFGLLLLPNVAFAQPWIPGPHAQGESTIIGFIDHPLAGATVEQGEELTILGWVVDQAALGWTGIDEVHIYRGTSSDQFLGRATYGVDRVDVANHFGNSAWTKSGFTLTVDATELPTGPQTLTVYAHTPFKGWWSRSVSINVAKGSVSATPESTQTVSWKTPRNHSVTTVESLQPALAMLAETPWGSWALDIAADKELNVLWASDLRDRFSLYQYGERLILLNDSYKEANVRALAAAIAHELQHALDETYGWASWRAVTCHDLAARAFLAQAAVWNAFYGPFGKIQALDPLEEAHNAVLSAVTVRPATWLDDAINKYHAPCS